MFLQDTWLLFPVYLISTLPGDISTLVLDLWIRLLADPAVAFTGKVCEALSNGRSLLAYALLRSAKD